MLHQLVTAFKQVCIGTVPFDYLKYNNDFKNITKSKEFGLNSKFSKKSADITFKHSRKKKSNVVLCIV